MKMHESFLCLSLGLAALAGSAVGARFQELALKELDVGDQYYIHGAFESSASPEQVYGILSDYSNLGGVFSGLHSSRVLERDIRGLLVEQVLVGQFLFWRKTVRLVLRVEERRPWRLDFSQNEGGPFRRYAGSWQVESIPGGSRVDYTLVVSRGDLAPIFVERKLFHENSRRLLAELQSAVERRAAAVPNCASPAASGL
jgi:ribosome-associated toxin RatA of RatAB toxin-antitoxin module